MSPNPTPWHKLKTNPLLQSVATPPTASAGGAREWYISGTHAYKTSDWDKLPDDVHVREVLARPQGEGACDGCGEPIGNRVFTVCDDCWDASLPKSKPTPRPPHISGEAMEWLTWFSKQHPTFRSGKYAREILRFIETAGGQE